MDIANSECDFSAAILLLLLQFDCMQTRTAAILLKV